MSRLHDWRFDCTVGSGVRADVYKFLGPQTEVLVVSGDTVRHILKTRFDRYTKPSRDEFVKRLTLEWLGDRGIFTLRHGKGAGSEHALWAHQRNISSQIFTRANFRELMQETFADKAAALCDAVGRVADRGEHIDMQQKFFAYTMDSITRIFLGRDADTVTHGKEADPYGVAYDEAHRCLMKYYFKSMKLVALSGILPWPFGGLRHGIKSGGGVLVHLHHAIHPDARAMKEAVRTLTTESLRAISARRADPTRQLDDAREQRKRIMAGAGALVLLTFCCSGGARKH
eukprot:gene18839-42087_t